MKVGDKVKIKIGSKVRMDFNTWKYPYLPNGEKDPIFVIDKFFDKERVWVKAKGFGKEKDYGNGKILVHKKDLIPINNKKALLEYYMKLPYSIKITPCEEGGYVAKVIELKGCITQADNWQELYKQIEDAKKGWIETAIEEEINIPLPEVIIEKIKENNF